MRVEEFTGASIGSTSITTQYQPAILDLSIADVTTLMALQGADVGNIGLGDFSVGKGAGTNLFEVSKMFKERGEESRLVNVFYLRKKFKFWDGDIAYENGCIDAESACIDSESGRA